MLLPPTRPPLADLSLKTLKMFGEIPNSIDADFYFKIDDDVGVNVAALADYLQERRTQGNLYLVVLGFCGVGGLGAWVGWASLRRGCVIHD